MFAYSIIVKCSLSLICCNSTSNYSALFTLSLQSLFQNHLSRFQPYHYSYRGIHVSLGIYIHEFSFLICILSIYSADILLFRKLPCSWALIKHSDTHFLYMLEAQFQFFKYCHLVHIPIFVCQNSNYSFLNTGCPLISWMVYLDSIIWLIVSCYCMISIWIFRVF